MHTASELSQMYRFPAIRSSIVSFTGLRGTKDGMVVRINSLRDAKICTALPQGFQVTIKAFILCKEEPDNLSGGIIDGTMKSVFHRISEPFIRGSVNLNQLSGMGVPFSAVGTVPDFFLFGAFKSCIF